MYKLTLILILFSCKNETVLNKSDFKTKSELIKVVEKGDSQILSKKNQDDFGFYLASLDTNIKLKHNDYYDVELKPKKFELRSVKEIEADKICMLNIYRLMSYKGNKALEKHFYRTFELTNVKTDKKGFEDIIDLNGILAHNNNRFLNTEGFVFEICLVSKKSFLKLKNSNQCFVYSELLVNYPF